MFTVKSKRKQVKHKYDLNKVVSFTLNITGVSVVSYFLRHDFAAPHFPTGRREFRLTIVWPCSGSHVTLKVGRLLTMSSTHWVTCAQSAPYKVGKLWGWGWLGDSATTTSIKVIANQRTLSPKHCGYAIVEGREWLLFIGSFLLWQHLRLYKN